MTDNGCLRVGQQAPDFTATAVVDQEFKEISLSQYRGKYVVLFFYPLDFTFVCPTEITAFSDRYSDFSSKNTEVDQWLDSLPASESEDFREFAEVTPSVIEIWVYAGIIGYTGSFNDLSRWIKMKFKKLNRHEILNSEIAALHSDIQELRMAVTSGEIKGSDGAARLAALEKELRSHIETSERMNRTTDKRGLIMAGADRVMREMTAIFKDDPQFAEPIDNAMNAVWAKIYSELTSS